MRTNGNFKGLFVTDLDGTLLIDAKNFNPKDLKALQLLKSQGIATAIATGRSHYSFCSLMKSLGMRGTNQLPIDYVVLSTGAGVMEYPSETLLESIPLQEEDVSAIARLLEAWGCDYMIHKPVPDTHHFLYRLQSGKNADFERRLKIYSDFATPLSAGGLVGVTKATELLCIVEKGKGADLMLRLQKALPQCSVVLATSPLDGSSEWVEVFAHPVSKSQSVARLCTRLGISQKDTCAVGNDFNDQDLLHWAANSYLVENGPSCMKQLFSVVSSNNEAGVNEAINRWLSTLDHR